MRRRIPALSPANLRLAWLGVVAFGVVFGIGELARWLALAASGGGWLGYDANLVLGAADRLRNGLDPYADPIFLWAPASAAVVAALSAIPPSVLIATWAIVKVAACVWITLYASRGLAVGHRTLAVVGVLSALPVLHDIALGNVMVPLALGLAYVAWSGDGVARGVPLGIVAALVPKPLLIPIGLWMLVHRRRALVGASASGAVVTLVAALALGPGIYVDWVRNLIEFGPLAATFPGNGGLSALAPALVVPVAVVAIGGLVVVLALRVDVELALLYALAAGIVAAPYASQLSALPLLVALPGRARRYPGLTVAFAAILPVAVEWALPVYAAAICVVAAALAVAERRTSAPIVGRIAPSPVSAEPR